MIRVLENVINTNVRNFRKYQMNFGIWFYLKIWWNKRPNKTVVFQHAKITLHGLHAPGTAIFVKQLLDEINEFLCPDKKRAKIGVGVFIVPYRWNRRGLMVCALCVSPSHFSGSCNNFESSSYFSMKIKTWTDGNMEIMHVISFFSL